MKYNVNMSKIKIIFVLSIWMTILTYLGFPQKLKDLLFLISGLILISISYLLYRELRKGEEGEELFDNFSENSDFEEKKEMKSSLNSDVKEESKENFG